MSLWQELRRRKVIRVVIAYAIAAWALIEFAATVEEPLGLPLWTDTLVIVLMGIGLPIAIVVSWMFDLGPSGVTVTPPAPEPIELEPGRVVGHFAILGRLGEGGMGVVYRARDTTLDRLVALKFLPDHLSSDEDASRRFLHEARAAGNLDHPNICTIHEIGELQDGRRYIAMPLYEGETLKALLSEQQRLAPERVAGIGAQIARGLAAAHEAGIVHRDIKPANVVLTHDGQVKILDFGIAKKAGTDLTGRQGAIGSVAYMSPEQARGESLDGRSDIWSLGVVLFELCTGTRPFGGLTSASTLYEILELDPPALADLIPGIPAELSDLVDRSLEKNPDDRPADAAEVTRLLGRIRAEGGQAVEPLSETTVAATPSSQSPSSTSERRLATVLIARLAGLSFLEETFTPRQVTETLERWRAAMRGAVEEFGGVVISHSGESLQALFGVPVAYGDEPVRAVHSALAIVRAIGDLLPADGLAGAGIACGVDTGRAIVRATSDTGDFSYRVSGGPLDHATTLAAQAVATEVLVTDRAARQVDPFFHLEPADAIPSRSDDSVAAVFRATGATPVRSRLEATDIETLTRLMGREAEMAHLSSALAAARTGNGSLISISGDAGVGKSRLLFEFAQTIDRDQYRIARGRCEPFGSDAPYHPFLEALRDRLGIGPTPQSLTEAEVADRLRAVHPDLVDLLGFYLPLLALGDDPGTLQESAPGEQLRVGLVEALAGLFTLGSTDSPTVLLLEDWHWADDGSRLVLRQLAEMVPAYPLLVVATARPRGDEGDLVTWGHLPGHRALLLGPLSPRDSAAVMEMALGAASLPGSLEHFLYEKSGGNPFFLEEICRSLLEEGAITVEEGVAEFGAEFERHELPDTVQGVLRTRLDRLEANELRVLQSAAVVGRDFSRELLAHAIGEDIDVETALSRLRELGLIQQIRILPRPLLRFKHSLTRDVVYDGLLERQRAEMHGRVGAAIESLYAERLDEYAEQLTEHFALSREWEKALDYAIVATDRLWTLSSFQEAAELQGRALEWLDHVDDLDRLLDKRVDLLLRQERLFEFLGLRDRQRAIIDELLEILDREHHPAHLTHTYQRLGDYLVLTRDYEAAENALGKGLDLARERDDLVAERQLLRSMGLLMWHSDRPDEALALGERALELDRQLGSRAGQVISLSNLGQIHRSLGHMEQALECLEQALEIEEAGTTWVPGMLSKRSYILHMMGSIHAELGHSERARELLEGARAASAVTEGVINVVQAHFHLTALARLELLEGHVDRAVELYRECVALCRKTRHLEGLAIALRLLGEMLLNLEQQEEAIPLLAESAEIYRQMRDLSAAARMWRLAAVGRESIGDTDGRVDALRKVVDLAHESGVKPLELEAAESLARQASGSDPKEALQWFGRALGLAVEEGLEDHAGAIDYAIGVIHWQEGRLDEALRSFESSHRRLEPLSLPSRAGLAWNSVGRCLRDLGHGARAREVLESAAAHHEEHGLDLLKAHAWAMLGDLDLDEERPERAIERFAAALSVRESLGDEVGRGWMLLSLARAHRQVGSETGMAYYIDEAREIAGKAGESELLAACDTLSEPDAG